MMFIAFIVLSIALMGLCNLFNFAWWGYILAEIVFAVFFWGKGSTSTSSSNCIGSCCDWDTWDSSDD